MIEHEIRRPPPRGQRLAAGYVLGALFVALLILLWTRGAGRFVLPLLLLGGAALLVRRLIRK